VSSPGRETISESTLNPIAADVYAGDVTTPTRSADIGTTFYLFRVEADLEPDVFARVACIFNIANCAPHRATLCRQSASAVTITVAIELSGAGVADMIRRKLEQLTSTLSVELVIGEPD
jgi:hypothetical protein